MQSPKPRQIHLIRRSTHPDRGDVSGIASLRLKLVRQSHSDACSGASLQFITFLLDHHRPRVNHELRPQRLGTITDMRAAVTTVTHPAWPSRFPPFSSDSKYQRTLEIPSKLVRNT